jgi:hypothetical protein
MTPPFLEESSGFIIQLAQSQSIKVDIHRKTIDQESDDDNVLYVSMAFLCYHDLHNGQLMQLTLSEFSAPNALAPRILQLALLPDIDPDFSNISVGFMNDILFHNIFHLTCVSSQSAYLQTLPLKPAFDCIQRMILAPLDTLCQKYYQESDDQNLQLKIDTSLKQHFQQRQSQPGAFHYLKDVIAVPTPSGMQRKRNHNFNDFLFFQIVDTFPKWHTEIPFIYQSSAAIVLNETCVNLPLPAISMPSYLKQYVSHKESLVIHRCLQDFKPGNLLLITSPPNLYFPEYFEAACQNLGIQCITV